MMVIRAAGEMQDFAEKAGRVQKSLRISPLLVDALMRLPVRLG
jgi:hypothetical protein